MRDRKPWTWAATRSACSGRTATLRRPSSPRTITNLTCGARFGSDSRRVDAVVDIGANVGCIALMAATLVGDAGIVVAVEPNPENLQMLYAGMVLNGLANVRVLPHAASIRSEVVSLSRDTSNTYLVAAGAPGRCVYAQTVALDEALALAAATRSGEDRRGGARDRRPRRVPGGHGEAPAGARRRVQPRCLVQLQRREPAELVDRLLALYPSVRVTSAFGDDEPFSRTAELLEYWRERNREVTAAGLLPDGLLHFDLVVERGRPRRDS